MKEYIVSCNPISFDIVEHFRQTKNVVWRQTKSCEPGDIVYIYVGRPYSAIKYKCTVIESDIEPAKIESPFYVQQATTKRNKNKPFMLLRMEQELDEDGLHLSKLIEHGLKTVQCTTMVEPKLKQYLDSRHRMRNDAYKVKR